MNPFSYRIPPEDKLTPNEILGILSNENDEIMVEYLIEKYNQEFLMHPQNLALQIRAV